LSFGGSDGFRDQGAGVIDQLWVDGVGITNGTPRQHVFTFATGIAEFYEPNFLTSECPCDGGTQPPSFVGTSYLCEGATLGESGGARVYDPDDVLFDGQDIGDPSCVDSFESAPDFNVLVGAPTALPLDVHLMQSQGTGDEDLDVIALELWVR
jgi:dynein heavy chain